MGGRCGHSVVGTWPHAGGAQAGRAWQQPLCPLSLSPLSPGTSSGKPSCVRTCTGVSEGGRERVRGGGWKGGGTVPG